MQPPSCSGATIQSVGRPAIPGENMFEVLAEAFQLVNLPFTILLSGVLLYWMLVGLGLLHFGEAGHDASLDAHGDLHGHLPADAHAGGHGAGDAHGDAAGDGHGGGAGWFMTALKFVNVGEVPATVVISILALCAWLLSMISNHYWNDNSVARALVFLLPNLLLSAVVTRYLTFPLKRFFMALNREYEEHEPLIGRTGIVITTEAGPSFGQAQIETKGAPLLINVRTLHEQVLQKGETCVIVDEDKEHSFYRVVRLSVDQ